MTEYNTFEYQLNQNVRQMNSVASCPAPRNITSILNTSQIPYLPGPTQNPVAFPMSQFLWLQNINVSVPSIVHGVQYILGVHTVDATHDFEEGEWCGVALYSYDRFDDHYSLLAHSESQTVSQMFGLTGGGSVTIPFTVPVTIVSTQILYIAMRYRLKNSVFEYTDTFPGLGGINFLLPGYIATFPVGYDYSAPLVQGAYTQSSILAAPPVTILGTEVSRVLPPYNKDGLDFYNDYADGTIDPSLRVNQCSVYMQLT